MPFIILVVRSLLLRLDAPKLSFLGIPISLIVSDSLRVHQEISTNLLLA